MSHLPRTQALDDLFQAVLSLQDIDECYSFFSDLLTAQEVTSFSQRLQVAQLLFQGSKYKDVADQIPVGSATITRINTELQYGAGGYKLVLARLAAQNDFSHQQDKPLSGDELQ